MPTFSFLEPTATVGATLAQLGAIAGVFGTTANTRVTSVSLDHRHLAPGALFAALPGRVQHGASHSARAAAAGATAILTDERGAGMARAVGLPVLVVADVRAALGGIAAEVFGTANHRPQLLGVTGTNGKTTTVHLLDALLTQLGVPSGRSSTVDRRSGDSVVASRLTTPEAPELHALLARMTEDGVTAAALEVSAQGLSRHRVDGMVFDVAGFTNLSHDHRDDYATEDEYLAAKLALFQPDRARRGVVLLDSPAGSRVRDRAGIPVTTVSSRTGTADWTVTVTGTTTTSTAFTLAGPAGERVTTSVPLLGQHLAADGALALVMLVEGGYDVARVQRAVVGGIEATVPGRSDLLSGPTGPRVYLDFSHTPDSIEKTLAAIRRVTGGTVVVIVGADGDRDPSKRHPMGRAAARGADVVIVTDHHPRFEDPAVIRGALLAGARSCSGTGPVWEIADPATAIRAAIRLTGNGDAVLWVGPGQTDYRVVGGEDLPYSPREDTRRALAEAGWPTVPARAKPSPRR